MNLAALKSYVQEHAATLEGEAAAVLHRFSDWVHGEEAKIRDEVAHLTGRGYTVVPPQPDQPQAPASPQ